MRHHPYLGVGLPQQSHWVSSKIPLAVHLLILTVSSVQRIVSASGIDRFETDRSRFDSIRGPSRSLESSSICRTITRFCSLLPVISKRKPPISQPSFMTRIFTLLPRNPNNPNNTMKSQKQLLFTTSTSRLSFVTPSELALLSEHQEVHAQPIPFFARQIGVSVHRRRDRPAQFWGTVDLPFQVVIGRLLGWWKVIYVVDPTFAPHTGALPTNDPSPAESLLNSWNEPKENDSQAQSDSWKMELNHPPPMYSRCEREELGSQAHSQADSE